MKRILLSALTLTALAFSANAQVEKGTVWVGANARFFSQDFSHEAPGLTFSKSKGYHLTPSVGYTFKDNQVAGLTLGFGHASMKGSNAEGAADAYGAGVFYRRYFKLVRGLYVYGQGFADYSFSHATTHASTDYFSDTRQHSVQVGIYPGVAYRLHQRVFVEAAWQRVPTFSYTNFSHKINSLAGYRYQYKKDLEFGTPGSSFSPISLGFRIGLGK